MLLTFTDNFHTAKGIKKRDKNTVAVDNKNFDSLFFRVDFLSTLFDVSHKIGNWRIRSVDNISG